MEPFRVLIADSAVLSAINTRMVTARDFVRAGQSVALRPDGRKAFFRAYEQRMDTLVTHPLFGYRLNYRRMLEIQTRLLARRHRRDRLLPCFHHALSPAEWRIAKNEAAAASILISPAASGAVRRETR
jgi:hypothetical protein